MSTAVQEIENGRTLVIDGKSQKNPTSIFIARADGSICWEFDRRTFLTAIKRELDLFESVDISIERLLETA